MSSNFLRSLSLAVIFSSVAPTLLISSSLAGTWLLTYVPGLESIGRSSTNMLIAFLTTFGGGCAVQGVLTISLVCGFVGALFDIYTFYSFQSRGE